MGQRSSRARIRRFQSLRPSEVWCLHRVIDLLRFWTCARESAFRRAWRSARPTAFTRFSSIQTRSASRKTRSLAELARYERPANKTAADLHALLSEGGQPGRSGRSGHLSRPRVDPSRSGLHQPRSATGSSTTGRRRQARCTACSTNTRRSLPARTTSTSRSGWPTSAT